jgi:hypothetical protein
MPDTIIRSGLDLNLAQLPLVDKEKDGILYQELSDIHDALLKLQSGIEMNPYKLRVALGQVPGVAVFEKFGKNSDVDTGTAPEDLWNGGGLYTGFPTGAAETLEVSSSSGNDTLAGSGAQTLRIQNLRDATGAIAPDIDVNMNGTGWVSLGGLTYNRSSRMRVLTAGSTGWNEGTITLRHTTTTTNIFAVMPATYNRTHIAAYTVPLGHQLEIDNLTCFLSRANGAAGSASMSFRAREPGGVFESVVAPEISNSQAYKYEGGYLIFPELTDLVWRADNVSDNNSIIGGEFSGELRTL